MKGAAYPPSRYKKRNFKGQKQWLKFKIMNFYQKDLKMFFFSIPEPPTTYSLPLQQNIGII